MITINKNFIPEFVYPFNGIEELPELRQNLIRFMHDAYTHYCPNPGNPIMRMILAFATSAIANQTFETNKWIDDYWRYYGRLPQYEEQNDEEVHAWRFINAIKAAMLTNETADNSTRIHYLYKKYIY